MRIPRVRFTVGNSMIAVAVIALLIAGTMTTVRIVRERRLAFWFGQAAIYHRQHEQVRIIRARNRQTGQSVGPEQLGRMNRAWRLHHAALRRKYEHAKAHPSIPIPLDPPHPVFDGQRHLSIDIRYAN